MSLVMYSHQKFWQVPFCSNTAAYNPKIKAKIDTVIINESGHRQFLLLTLFSVSSIALIATLTLDYLPAGLKIPVGLMFTLALVIIGFLHFRHTFIKTKFIKGKYSAVLSLRSLKQSIPIDTITAFQILPTINNDETTYHCYALIITKTEEVVRFGLFKNHNSLKHATDCLAVANFCDKPIWEAHHLQTGSIFTIQQKLENPTVIHNFSVS